MHDHDGSLYTSRSMPYALLLAILATASCGKPPASATPKQPATPVEPSSAAGAQSEDRLAATAGEGAPEALPSPSQENAGQTVATSAPSSELGQQLYARHCAACHGEQGDGRGSAAAYLFPKPRDFQAARFRLVSTANNIPTREDLHAVLLRGMPGSSMPPWDHLSQTERDALVDEVLRLRREGARAYYIQVLQEQEGLTDEDIAAEDVQQEIQDFLDDLPLPGEPTVVPPIGEATAESIARAKETYAKYGCLQCHGKDGKGDGVEKMVDSEGYPTSPRDFTAGIFKGGDDPKSLYRRIAYGMPGTPMPGSQQMSPQAMVELVHYIRSLSTEQQRQAAVLNREQMVAKAMDSLPADANGAGWSEVPRVSLRMTPLWWRNDADPDLQVQAAHDRRTLALRISWKDDRQDGHAASSEMFEDAVALQLYRGDDEPFLGMGGSQSAVDVWFWDADRQGEPLAVEKLYPNSVVDVYPLSETAATSAELDREGAATADQPPVSLPARASGNQIVPTNDDSGASALSSGGPGTSTFRLPGSQHVRALGVWQEGRWTVVMTRPLRLATPGEGLSLAPGDKVSAALAVWDGAAKDRDGKKLITIWQDLILEN